MRLGQATCSFAHLISDPEIRVAMVPLTEGEYVGALEAVAALGWPDDLAHAALKDRRQSQEILIRAIREPDDLEKWVYSSIDELMADFEVNDVDHVIEEYNAMTALSSPTLDGLDPQEFEHLKKALQEMDWNALSGRAWYAARRFLSEIIPSPLLDNSPGFGSTSSSTTTSDSEKSTTNA